MLNFNQRGPMTGRKMGRCGNFGAGLRYPTTQENENIENSINENPQGQGMGRGRGRGLGRGMKNGMGQGQGRGQAGRMNRGGRDMGQVGDGGRGMGRRFRDIQE